MSTLEITVNDREYNIACDDGQEPRLLALAGLLDAKVTELKSAMGAVSDNMLLVLAGIMLADEVSDLRREAENLRAQAEGGESAHMAQEQQIAQQVDEKIADTVNNIAARIEKMVSEVETA